MAYLEELLPEFRNGAKIRCKSWKAGEYIYVDKKGSVMTEKRNIYILDNVDFTSKCWELYQEPIDWDYVIKNKCLCWFWDFENKKYIGFLKNVDKADPKFFKESAVYYHNCRPVRRDEVTFYEDKRDGNN